MATQTKRNTCALIKCDISTLNSSSLKPVDKFTYPGRSISSTKADINTQIAKAWTAIDRLLVIWESDLIDIIKFIFFQALVVSILLYGCTHHHHHHVMPLARISQTLSRHFSQSFIASGRSSRLHPVSSHSCCMYVRAGRPAFARPYAGVHRSTSLMSSSLLLQQCPACLFRLTCIVFVMGGRWPYSWCLVGCCRQDLFNIARNILV